MSREPGCKKSAGSEEAQRLGYLCSQSRRKWVRTIESYYKYGCRELCVQWTLTESQ